MDMEWKGQGISQDTITITSMQAPAEEPNFAGEPALDADEIWALDDEPNADYM